MDLSQPNWIFHTFLVLELAFRPDPTRSEPLYEQLASYLAGLVEAGRMVPGERLPATRELAAQLEISRNTICHAFQRLVDRHLLVSHVGQGTFVAARPLRAIDGGLAADVDSVARGAIAAIAMDYYQMGRQSALMAERIFKGASTSDMPVETLQDLKLYVNPANAKDMGVKVPESVTQRADKIIK